MNQDRIRDRILRRASRMWGYSESETENSFDPLVGLLISACASELEKLSFEQENSRARIIDRILEVMFPEEVAGALPAHTLLQVYPTENNTLISLYDSFRTTKKKQNIYNPQENNDILVDFAPTIPLKLTTAKVKYMAYGNQLVEQENFFFNEEIAKTVKPLPVGELWLGIETADDKPLEDLQFFIEVTDNEQKELFYHYLKLAKITFENKEYSLNEGYNTTDEPLNLNHIITKNYNTLSTIRTEINQFYAPYFYTLKGILPPPNKEIYSELKSYFSNIEDKLQGNILWIKFSFPSIIYSNVFQNIRFILNCVPAINISRTVVTERLNGVFNIFPIQTNKHFLDIDYIADNKGKRFDLKDYSYTDENISLIFRRGGVSRFDSRDATELLQHLLELVKNETAAFSTLGIDATKETLKSIHQHIASMQEDLTSKGERKGNIPYLIVSSSNKDLGANCEVAFWHTVGEDGNGLKSGTKCAVSIDQSNMFTAPATILKTSIGGRNRLTSEEKLLELRSALLSRGRIVTIADIEAFGMSHFKSAITTIEVTKGTKKEVSTTQGFSRTIDIYLTKNNTTQNISPEEWEYLKESFMLKLKSASANMYPFRLFEKRKETFIF